MLKNQMQLTLRNDAEHQRTWDGLPEDVRAQVVERCARLITKAAKPEATQKRSEKHDDNDE